MAVVAKLYRGVFFSGSVIYIQVSTTNTGHIFPLKMEHTDICRANCVYCVHHHMACTHMHQITFWKVKQNRTNNADVWPWSSYDVALSVRSVKVKTLGVAGNSQSLVSHGLWYNETSLLCRISRIVAPVTPYNVLIMLSYLQRDRTWTNSQKYQRITW